MIAEIELKNFQRHRSLVIKLDPKVTTVVGDSDVGKSAVFRALRWAMQNVPTGADFVHWGAKHASVTLTLQTGDTASIIVRLRGRGENSYNLNTDEYKAFVQGVPPTIAALLKVSDLNFQAQHDPPFWFAETSGEVSRQLNAIINLGIIDNMQQQVAYRLRKATAAVEVSEQRLRTAKQAYNALKPAVSMDEDLQAVEAAQAKHTEAFNRFALLRAVCLKLSSTQAEQKDARQRLVEGRLLVELGGKALRAQIQATEFRGALRHLVQGERMASLKIPDIKLVHALHQQHQELKVKRGRLLHTIETLRNSWRTRKATAEAAKVAHTQFHLSTKGQRCPLCQHEL